MILFIGMFAERIRDVTSFLANGLYSQGLVRLLLNQKNKQLGLDEMSKYQACSGILTAG